MYSSKDAANPAYPTQWALNPTAYQNMDTSQVDWAALAQQWIAMKEAAAIVAPPPPPPIKPDNEEGEAPMEVENPEHNSDGPPDADWNANSNSWGDNWNQWGWGWSGPGPVDHKVTPDLSTAVAPVIDGYPVTSEAAAPMPGYSTGTVATPTFQHGYWTAPQPDQSNSRSSSRGRERRSKSKTKDYKPPRGSRPPRDKPPVLPPVIEPIIVPSAHMPTPMIDAAKRRQLPAWIREGLEKMEREKQRAIEREQEEKARKEAEEEKKRLEQEELERIKAAAGGQPVMPPKSKFESDSETEEMEDVKDDNVESSPVKEETTEESPKQRINDETHLIKKSKEEIMQEVMLAVRRSLTEILLEVTDQEIYTVSQEEWVRYTAAQASRLNAMKASKSKALAAITTGLGLGAYESSSEESADEDEQKDLTDQQLQEIIRRKRLEFERTSREIEAAVRRAEQGEAGPYQDEPTTPEHPNRSRSSVTPPVDSETLDKVSERRISKDKRTPHRTVDKSIDKVDGLRKLGSIPEERNRTSSYKDRTPSPNKTSNTVNHKDELSSSSDSEDDSSSSSSESSSSSKSETKIDDRPQKKRKRESTSSNDSRTRSKRDKLKKTEEKTSHPKSKYYDDYDKLDKSKSKKRDDYYDRYKSSRDRYKGKYRDDSDDDRPKKRVKRSRSVSHESRSGRRRGSRDRREKKSYERESSRRERSRDKRSYERDSSRRESSRRERSRDKKSHERESSRRERSRDKSGRDYDKYDRYERCRDGRRRSRSGSYARHRR